MVLIIGVGNPLLDITVKIEDDGLLRKHNLKMDDQSEIDEKQMKLLLNDIKSLDQTQTLGGSVQNTLRIAQWLTSNKYRTCMIGALGNDERGQLIKDLIAKDGVEILCSTSDEKPTGVTVALVKDDQRSLVAYIGAAETFSIKNFTEIIESQMLFESVDILYMEGFFLTNRQNLVKYLLEYISSKNKLFAYNLSAPYICAQNQELVKCIIENCDILFGNLIEYKSLVEEVYELEPNIDNIMKVALELIKSRNCVNFKYNKIILITNGSEPVTCIYGDGQQTSVAVEKISPEKLGDTTGAGDAFVAGFLIGLLKDLRLEKCVQYGIWTANEIIQQIGCKSPNYLPSFQ